MFSLVLFAPAMLNDGDTFWQIPSGLWILDHRALPASDPFSFTAAGRPWFPHEWLAETLMALAFKAGGMKGVMALTAGAVGVTAGVLMHVLRRFLPGVQALVGLVFALSLAAPSMLARPHVLAWPCLAVWCGGLVMARARRSAPAFRLLPVMVLWVNLHGSFMLGLLLPGAFLIEALVEHGADRRKVLLAWCWFIVAAWAVALLNPAFLAGLLFPLQLLRMDSLGWIGEWRPTDFGHLQPLEIAILAGLALGFSGRARLPPIRLLMLLALLHAALSHQRHQQLLGIVGALILAEPLGRSLVRSAPRASFAGAGVVLAVAAAVGRMLVPLGAEPSGMAFAAVLGQLPPALRARPVLNEYGLGGPLIFNGIRPFIDSRADLYGDAFLARYQRIISPDQVELRRALTGYGIAWTIFPSDDPIVAMIDREPGWRRLAETDGLVIQTRDSAP